MRGHVLDTQHHPTVKEMPAVIIERDVTIPMEDGLSLRADVFRPDDQMPVPVVMTLGPYEIGRAHV